MARAARIPSDLFILPSASRASCLAVLVCPAEPGAQLLQATQHHVPAQNGGLHLTSLLIGQIPTTDRSSRIVADHTLSGPAFLPLGTTSLDILILIPQIIRPDGAPPSMQSLSPSFPASHSVHVHGNRSPSLIPALPPCKPVLPICVRHLPNTLRNPINPAPPLVPTWQYTYRSLA